MEYSDFSVKDLPKSERPRERLLHIGSSSLSVTELLSIIIGKGYVGEPVNLLSQKLLFRFGDVNKLGSLSAQEFLDVKGIGIAKACQLVACFELARRISGGSSIKSKECKTPTDIHNLVKPFLLHRQREHFLVISFDARRKLLGVNNLSVGSVNQCIIHPREVFKAAINWRASYIALAHNHPSQDLSASEGDVIITKRIVEASYTIGIPVIDHIIVGDNGFRSILKDGVIIE